MADLDERFGEKFRELGDENSTGMIRFLLLSVLDSAWKEHLLSMDELRRGIGLRAIGQKDPLLEYQFESYNLFQGMMERVRISFSDYFFKVTVMTGETSGKIPASRGRESRENLLPLPGSSAPNIQVGKPPARSVRKTGRNEPCPCGSGKKYKHCCGRNI
jgi:preprotein translocase subunit SecA